MGKRSVRGLAERAFTPATRLGLQGIGYGFLLFSIAPWTSADCRIELELLSRDLKGVSFTDIQIQQMAPFVDDALKRCRVGREDAAVGFLDKARAVAGIPKKVDDLDLPVSPAKQ